MRTEQILYFLETVKTGSFTKAAENLGVQQPSLREGITKLEDELGAPLFNRGKRGVELNDYGRYCLPHMQFMAHSYEKIKQANSPVVKGMGSEIHIDVQKSYDMYLPTFYQMAKNNMSYLQFYINTENSIDAITNRIMQNKTNIGFVTMMQDEMSSNQFLQAVRNGNLSSSVIRSFEMQVLMRKDHPLSTKKVVDLKSFYDYQMIVTNTESFLENKLDLSKVDVLKMNNWRMVEYYLETTNGLALTAGNTNKNIELISKPLNVPIILLQLALYKGEALDEKCIQIINTMKLALDMTFVG